MYIGASGTDPVRVNPSHPPSPYGTPTSGNPGRRQLRVLIVDSSKVVRQALAELLQANGFTVLAATGQDSEAPDLVSRLRPDVVILDRRLGATTGLAVARLIMTSNPRVRVLLYTTHPPTAEAARAAGVHEVIVKRASPAILLDALRVLAQELSKGRPDSGCGLT